MTNQLELLQDRVTAGKALLHEAEAEMERCVSNLCALPLGPNLALDYARGLGEYEMIKAQVHKLRSILQVLSLEIENFTPSKG
jgi:hypothetical protein